ncbi:MAG: hypothetical protein U0929_09325 [Planctomycetaceae bacterium]
MFTRRILHHGPTPDGTAVLLADRAVSGCWFELHRQGGCGAGELVLQRDFQERSAIQIGDWISCEVNAGERWYLGRVEECRYQYPGLLRLRLAGMSIQLNEVFPGGFGASPSTLRPHRYAATDLFTNDPDRDWEVVYPVSSVVDLVRQLVQHHVVGQTHISYVSSRVENPLVSTTPHTVKFRGEESIRSILKDLALRAQANWGVDALGQFFFIPYRTSLQTTFRLGRDLVSLEESHDRELIFNRLLLTGDYIYDRRDNSEQLARRVFRWRASYFEPDSVQAFGNRRLRLWVPWIRTQSDSVDFAREFFRTYARPAARYSIETVPQEGLLIPWNGPVSIEDTHGVQLARGMVEKVRVLFDHAPRFRLEVGAEDPREQWPEPPQDERWEIPDHIPSNGGQVDIPDDGFPDDGGGGDGGSSSTGDTSPPDDSSDDPNESSSGAETTSSPSDGSDGSSGFDSTGDISSGIESSAASSEVSDASSSDSSESPSSDPLSSDGPSSDPPTSVDSSDDGSSGDDSSSLTSSDEPSSEEDPSSDPPSSSSQPVSNPYSYWQDG